MDSAGGEPDGDQEFQIHQRIAGEQDRQIDREGLGKRYRQHRDRDEFDHLADGEAVEKGGELHHQNFPKCVAERERDFVRPLSPPVLHLKAPAVRA